MSFPRYPEYKDSGTAWLGEVPAHWEVAKFRHCFLESGEKIEHQVVGDMLSVSGYRGIEIKEYDDENRRRTDEDLVGYRIVRPGQLVVNTMWLNYAGLGVSAYEGHVSPAYRSYWIDAKLNKRFAHHLMRSSLYVIGYTKYLTGIRPNSLQMSRDDLMAFPVLIPSQQEQSAIATFLDRETAKIDALVAEQEKLIALLKEKRQAVISHAVTKGLDPNVPMKDSGIEWLGEVPAHWSVASVRRVIRRIEQGWSPDCLGRPAERDEWGVVKTGCVNRGVFAEHENKALPETLSPISDYEIHAGDVLMSRASGSPELVGSTAYVTATRPNLMLSDKIFRIHLEPSVNDEFFVAAFNSRVMRSQIERAISGAAGLANNLPQSSMKGFFFALPPLDEQKLIVRLLTSETTRIDALTSEAQCAIDLLRERRSALISATVTGKIDVRALASQAQTSAHKHAEFQT